MSRADVGMIMMEITPKDIERQGLNPKDIFLWLKELGYKLVTSKLEEDKRDPDEVLTACKKEQKGYCNVFFMLYRTKPLLEKK